MREDFITDQRTLFSLLFADDVVAVAKSKKDLKRVLVICNFVFRKVGKSINFGKSKFMPIGLTEESDWEPIEHEITAGAPILACWYFKYLGSILRYDGNVEDDVLNRKKLANIAIKNMWDLLFHRSFGIKLRFKIFKAFIYPVISFGCEHWIINKHIQNILDVWWMKNLRRILRITKLDKIRNITILNKLDTNFLSTELKRRQLLYKGHTCRHNNNRWTKVLDNYMSDNISKKHKHLNKKNNRLHYISLLLEEYNLDLGLSLDRKQFRTTVDNIFESIKMNILN